jgi:hypothetical protein
MNNTIKTLGLVGLLALAGYASVNSAKKTPFKMENTTYLGYKCSKEDGINLAYFAGRESGIINRDEKFDLNKTGGQYNVFGYTQFGQTYTTSNVPVKAESPVKVEAD